MTFLLQAFEALISYWAAQPMAGQKLHAEDMGYGPFIPRVDPRGDHCGWRCR
jgi:hypothetical protein